MNARDVAAAFEEIADSRENQKQRQIALWQAAELYEKGARVDLAATVYKRYIELFPKDFERTMEARHQLTQIYETSGRRAEYYRWLRQIVDSADGNKRSRTNRTQYLAANAAFLLAERGYVVVFQDVTRLKRLEEQEARNRRLVAMGEMAANIAHEIRNPLGSIELFASCNGLSIPMRTFFKEHILPEYLFCS